MCGITGIMTASGAPPDRAAIEAMQNALIHRGPDGAGVHFADSVGMAQRRLAIIDLETGDQPFVLDDGTALVANGEIYNYLELKAAMPNPIAKCRCICTAAMGIAMPIPCGACTPLPFTIPTQDAWC